MKLCKGLWTHKISTERSYFVHEIDAYFPPVQKLMKTLAIEY